VRYRFIEDGDREVPRPWAPVSRTVEAVAAAHPDIVHVNGLIFPGCVRALRAALPSDTAIVLQDHSGAVPRSLPWPLAPLSAARWHRAFADCDACTFTARDLADRWRGYGLPRDLDIIELPEAGTTLSPLDRDVASRQTGVVGAPAILWVGRLDANKDPFTVLEALTRVLPTLAQARCWMLFDGGSLESDVRARIAAVPALADRVTLVGAVPHERIHEYYSAADVFVSGSHHEGSGYALIEAMACGVTPCVTSIPAFRALAGTAGTTWSAGDADSCAHALLEASRQGQPADRARVRAHFDSHLHWDVIGRQTLRAYVALVEARRTGPPLT
jgi:glycosyltransferase involved in cell wall biosynthesis